MERFVPKVCRLSFYTEQNTSSSCKATGYFCTVIFTLATIGTIPFVAFTLPTVPLFTTCEDFASNVSSVFPSGVEILWANHTVRRVDSNMNNDEVVIEIPQIFLDIWTRDMVYPFSNPLADTLEMGMDYLDPDENMTSRFTFLDPYPRHIEFKVNDTLAYDASSVPKTNHNEENSDDSSWQTLVSRSHQQEWKGGKVLKVFGNQSLDHYSYLVQPLEHATRKPINVSALRTKQLTSTVRVILDENRYAKFKNQFVKFHRKQGEFSDIGYDLNSELVVIGPKQFIVLQGYSYLHHSYWEYVQNSQDSPSSRGLFQKNQIGNLQGYKPLHFGAVILCKQTLSGEGEVVGVRCSRKIANENIMEWCKPWTVLAIDVGVPVMVLLINFISLLLNQTTTHIILFTLPVYIVGNLLRHVDTPSHSFVQVSNLCVYTSIPYVILENLCMVLYKLSSTTLVLDEDLKELLHECIYHWKVYTVWLLWTIICLIHCRWSKYSNDFVQDGATLHQKPNIATKPKTTEANADELFEPSCRICFSGIEEGILISPCLCTGSMHFVHINCLNQWRSMSANPKSLHRCEQCSFAYSISRTKIAYVVRSALAVHLLAVLSFLAVVLFTAAGLAIVDNLILKGTMSTHWVGHEPMTNQPTSKIQSIQELATLVWEDVDLGDLVVEFVYGRKLFGFIDLFHVMGSVVLVGLFGFFTMNYYNIPFLLIRDVGRPNGNLRSGLGAALIVAVILGCVSLVTSLYGLFKSFTGKLLQSVEQRILEVGESYDEYETRRLSLLEAKQDLASNESSGLEKHAHNNQYSGTNNNKSAIESQEDTSSSKQEVAGIGERDESVLSRAPPLLSSCGVLEESGTDSQDTDHHQIYESISTTAVSDEETDLANVAQLGLRLRRVN